MANTGRRQVITLKQVQEPGDVPTGQTKNNIPGDPNYIAPFLDLTDCPITYDTACPNIIYTQSGTTLNWEFGLGNDVVLNPTVKKIVVALNTGGFQTTIVLPNATPNYFSGTFSALTISTTYTMIVTYLDASDSVLQTCTA